VIDEILPPAVLSAEAFADNPVRPRLFAEEEAQLARWGDARRSEFATVRVLARRALGDLGMPPVAIPRGGNGAPEWPTGVVGSMTHCPGFRAAAVAHGKAVRTIGVDAEPALSLPDGVLPLVSLPEEQSQLQRFADADPEVPWDRLLFCIKEAVYKAWFPLTKLWLGFEDVRVDIDREGAFVATVLAAGPRLDGNRPFSFSGHWLTRNRLLIAAVADHGAGPGGVRVELGGRDLGRHGAQRRPGLRRRFLARDWQRLTAYHHQRASSHYQRPADGVPATTAAP